MSRDLIHRYYNAFNAGDTDAMLACLTPDVAHHVNEGGIRVGQEAFRHPRGGGIYRKRRIPGR